MATPSKNHPKSQTYSLFGLTLASELRLVKRVALTTDATPDLTVALKIVDSLPREGADKPPSYVSPFQASDGQSILYAYREGLCDELSFPNTAEFHVWPDRIDCFQLKRAHGHEVERWLVGTVLALWLERNGTPVMHASAVVHDDSAMAFLASNTAGKSSLAAGLMQCGCSLLTDDVLPITRGDAGFFGQPGYPKMRMWPDVAEHFLGSYADLELVHPDATKRNVPVGPEGIGEFCVEPKQLRVMYLPARRDPEQGDTAVEINPISRRDALIELLRYSFASRLVTASGLQPQRLGSLALIADHVPMRRITYPAGLKHLPSVCETILEDFKALSGDQPAPRSQEISEP